MEGGDDTMASSQLFTGSSFLGNEPAINGFLSMAAEALNQTVSAYL
jgi:hypothetical protein